MLKWTLQKIVGSKNQREVKRLGPVVARINEIEEAYQRESEEQLRERVDGWKKHLHRYLPLEVATIRELERMEPEGLQATADALNARLDPLRDEFSSLPKVSANADSIEAAKSAFREIEESSFQAARAKYLDLSLIHI